MSSCDASIWLDKDRPTSYSSLDTIRGTAVLIVHKELAVESVQIKFEGFATTDINVKEKVYSQYHAQSNRVMRSESHTLIYQRRTLFPSASTRQPSDSGTKYTLKPGRHAYDFKFKIPMVNQCADRVENSVKHFSSPLPPSGAGYGFNVKYLVKLTVRRASWVKSNIRAQQSIQIMPFDPIDDVLAFSQPTFVRKQEKFTGMIPKKIAMTEMPTGPESYETPQKNTFTGKSSKFLKAVFKPETEEPRYFNGVEVPFFFEARLDDPFITRGQLPDYQLYITSNYGPDRYRGIDNQSSGLGQFILKSLKIDLICFGDLTAAAHTVDFERTYPMLNLTDLEYRIDLADLVLSPSANDTQEPYELEIKHSLYKKPTIQDGILPSFRTCNIDLQYKLRITAGFAESAKSWGSKKLTVSAPMKLLSGIPPPAEYIYDRQIPPNVAFEFMSRYPAEALAHLGTEPDTGQIPNYEEDEQPPPYQAPPT